MPASITRVAVFGEGVSRDGDDRQRGIAARQASRICPQGASRPSMPRHLQVHQHEGVVAGGEKASIGFACPSVATGRPTRPTALQQRDRDFAG